MTNKKTISRDQNFSILSASGGVTIWAFQKRKLFTEIFFYSAAAASINGDYVYTHKQCSPWHNKASLLSPLYKLTKWLFIPTWSLDKDEMLMAAAAGTFLFKLPLAKSSLVDFLPSHPLRPDHISIPITTISSVILHKKTLSLTNHAKSFIKRQSRLKTN